MKSSPLEILMGEKIVIVINRYPKEKANIPNCTKCVVKVSKIFDCKEMSKEFNFEEALTNSVELATSCLILDKEVIMGVVVLDRLSEDEASLLERRASRSWGSGVMSKNL